MVETKFEDIVGGRSNTLTDKNIKAGLVVDLIIGGILLVAFCILHSQSILYKFRLVSPSVSKKPPKLPIGKHALWAWLWATVRTSDLELLQTAGLDALMMVKICALGVQMFLPIMFFSMTILMPIHWFGGYLTESNTEGNISGFMRLTTTNVMEGSRILWVHFVLTFGYVAYTCWLLKWHYRQYVIVRQHYMRAGADANVWRELYANNRLGTAGRIKISSLAAMLTGMRGSNHGVSPATADNQGPTTPKPLALNGSSDDAAETVVAVEPADTGHSSDMDVQPARRQLQAGISATTMRQRMAGNSQQQRRTSSASLPAIQESGLSSPGITAAQQEAMMDAIARDLEGVPPNKNISFMRLFRHDEANKSADRAVAAIDAQRALEAAAATDASDIVISVPQCSSPAGIPTSASAVSLVAQETEHLAKLTELPQWWNTASRAYKPEMPGRLPKTNEHTSSRFAPPDVQEVEVSGPTGSQKAPGTMDLGRPSIGLRKTINTTQTKSGAMTSVNAQQYAILVTDVNQQLYNTRKPLWTTFDISWYILSWFPSEQRERVHQLMRAVTLTVRHWIFHDIASKAKHVYTIQDKHMGATPHRQHKGSNRHRRGLSDIPLDAVHVELDATLHGKQQPAVSNSLQDTAGTSSHGISQELSGQRASFSRVHGAADAAGKSFPCGEAQAEAHSKCSSESSLTQGKSAPAVSGPGPVAESSDPQYDSRRPGTTASSQTSGRLGHQNTAEITPRPGVARRSDDQGTGCSSPPGSSAHDKARAQLNWAIVRTAVDAGWVVDLLLDRNYSVVTSTFKALFPEDYDRAIPVVKHYKVDKLLLELDKNMHQYQRRLRYLEDTGKRPLGSTSCWKPWNKIDLLHHYMENMVKLQDQVLAARKEALLENGTPSWFVFFKTQQAAAIAAQTVLHSEDERQFSVQVAPGPEEVNWQALWMNCRQRELRGWMVKPILILFICIPVGIFTGGLMQLDFLFCPTKRCTTDTGSKVLTSGGSCPTNSTASSDSTDVFQWDWYCEEKSWTATYLSKLITGWLPGLLLALWQGLVLPLVMYLLVQAGGRCFSLSELDITIAKYMFWFNTLNSFSGGVLGSALVQQINKFAEKGPGEAFSIIGTFLPSSSNFFISYLLVRTLVLIPMGLLLPHVGARLFLLRRWFCRCTVVRMTNREKTILYDNVSPRYGFEVGMTMLVFLITMAYSVVSPIIVVLGVSYFVMSWVRWRFCLLYVYIRKYESGGLMWPFVFKRVIIILYIFNFFTICIFVVKKAYVQACMLCILVPFYLYRFESFCDARYKRATVIVPLNLAREAPPASVPPQVYIPPPLLLKSVAWHPEWSKLWAGWGLPAYSL